MKYLAPLVALALAASVTTATAKDVKNCPPGLAKKTPACVPPGLAKKGVTADDRTYGIGDRFDNLEDIVLRDGDRVIFEGREYTVIDTTNGTILRRADNIYRLPRDRDSAYVRIGDNLIKVNRETKEIIDLIRLADLILG